MGLDKNSVSYMHEYLKYAMEFEKYVYIWKQAMNDANNQMRAVYSRQNSSKSAFDSAHSSLETIDSRFENQRALSEQSASKYEKRSKITFVVFLVFLFISLAFSVVFFCAGLYAHNRGMNDMDIPILAFLSIVIFFALFVSTLVGPICLIVSLVSKSKAASSAGQAMNTSGSLERQKVLIEEQRSQAQSDYVEAVIRESAITKHQEEISTSLQKANQNLANLYSENVLPIKYRSFNAVATLYEYLDTGRCDKVMGHGGIYDTYENDLRLGLIIQNLIDMNSKLDAIQANQRLLYQELQQANHTLSTIRSSLTEIEKTNAEIASNTAISAVADRQTAVATQWLAWKTWANGY